MANIRRKNGSKRWTATLRVPQDIRELNPTFIQKKDGSPKTLLERALGTQDEKLAIKRAYDFEREMDARFEETRKSTGQIVREEHPLEMPAQVIREIKQRQEESPEEIKAWLRGKMIKQLEHMGLAPSDTIVLRMLDEVSKGFTDDMADAAIMLTSAVKQGEPTFDTLADIEKYKAKAKDTRVSVGVIFERYIQKRVADGPIKASSIKRAKTTFNAFCRSLPFGQDTAAETITVAKARAWVSSYQLELQEKGRALTTVTNNIDSITPAFNKAVDDELIPRNPFRKYTEALYKTKKGVKGNQANRSWINDDLSESALTNLLVAASQKFLNNAKSPSHRIMLPLIGLALYTGARIEELCRLTPNDIKTRAYLGVRYIDLDEAKSEAGIREIPLLPMAESIIDYLVSKTKSGADYLFPDLPTRDGRRSHSPSNEFSRFKKGLGYLTKNEYTFHSFRSTVITLLDRGDISDGYISMMVGHVEGRNTLAKRTYSAGRELKALRDQISCLSYDRRIDELLLKSLI